MMVSKTPNFAAKKTCICEEDIIHNPAIYSA
jgi:hypothetical protein